MVSTETLVLIGAIILAFTISALPLYLAVRMLGGRTSLLKAILITLVSGIVISLMQSIFTTYGSIIAFLVLIWIYHEVFRLRWLKAVLAWLLQLAIVVLFLVLAGFLLSLTGTAFFVI
jgi:hypothetical protein